MGKLYLDILNGVDIPNMYKEQIDAHYQDTDEALYYIGSFYTPAKLKDIYSNEIKKNHALERQLQEIYQGNNILQLAIINGNYRLIKDCFNHEKIQLLLTHKNKLGLTAFHTMANVGRAPEYFNDAPSLNNSWAELVSQLSTECIDAAICVQADTNPLFSEITPLAYHHGFAYTFCIGSNVLHFSRGALTQVFIDKASSQGLSKAVLQMGKLGRHNVKTQLTPFHKMAMEESSDIFLKMINKISAESLSQAILLCKTDSYDYVFNRPRKDIDNPFLDAVQHQFSECIDVIVAKASRDSLLKLVHTQYENSKPTTTLNKIALKMNLESYAKLINKLCDGTAKQYDDLMQLRGKHTRDDKSEITLAYAIAHDLTNLTQALLQREQAIKSNPVMTNSASHRSKTVHPSSAAGSSSSSAEPTHHSKTVIPTGIADASASSSGLSSSASMRPALFSRGVSPALPQNGIDAKDAEGKCAVDYAIEAGNYEVFMDLVKLGAKMPGGVEPIQHLQNLLDVASKANQADMMTRYLDWIERMAAPPPAPSNTNM